MIQARIPVAILRELPVGMETSELILSIRAGATEAVPESLMVWARRNGFDSGEEVQLLPFRVPAPALSQDEFVRTERPIRRKALVSGLLCLATTFGVSLFMALAFLGMSNDPDTGLMLGIVWAVLLWLLLPAAPLFLVAAPLPMDLHATSSKGQDRLDLLPLIFVGTWFAINLTGWALVARARGLSPWLALIGALSLCFRGRKLP